MDKKEAEKTKMQDFYEYDEQANSHSTLWATDGWGIVNALIKLPQGIVTAWVDPRNRITQMTFVTNGRSVEEEAHD